MRQKTFFKIFFTFRQLVPITMEQPLFKDYVAEGMPEFTKGGIYGGKAY